MTPPINLDEIEARARTLLAGTWMGIDPADVLALAARVRVLEAQFPWAINQMRRAARTLELVAVGATLPVDNFYVKGLDNCADALEQMVTP